MALFAAIASVPPPRYIYLVLISVLFPRNIVNSVCFELTSSGKDFTHFLNTQLTNQRQLIVNEFGFSTKRTTLLGMVDGAVESASSYGLHLLSLIFVFAVVTIWFGISIVRFVGRGYAGVIAFAPALVGAILLITLPSHNKIGLLFSYWVSSEFPSICQMLRL